MSEPSYAVIYLTGPPATGKSTLVDALAQSLHPLLAFCYSKELARYVSQRIKAQLSQEEMRRQSSQVILSSDVQAVDELLVQTVQQKRSSTHIVIDSHAVTKESYGFRVTPFSLRQLEAIQPTLIFCLYAPSSVLVERIGKNNQGRPLPSPFEADFHTGLQGTVAINYGIHLGIPIYFLDSTAPTDLLVKEIVRRVERENAARPSTGS